MIRHSLQILCFALLSNLTQAQDAATSNSAPPSLSGDQGYLLLEIDAQRPVAELTLNSSVAIRDIKPGKSYRVLPLPSGNYQWQSISVPHFDLPFKLKLDDEKKWSFSVVAGTVNYVGHLMVMEERSYNAIDVRLVNRSTLASEQLASQNPALAKLPFRFAGFLRDDFTQYLQPPANKN